MKVVTLEKQSPRVLEHLLMKATRTEFRFATQSFARGENALASENPIQFRLQSIRSDRLAEIHEKLSPQFAVHFLPRQ